MEARSPALFARDAHGFYAEDNKLGLVENQILRSRLNRVPRTINIPLRFFPDFKNCEGQLKLGQI